MRFLGLVSGKARQDLDRFSEFLDKEQVAEVRRLVGKRKAGVFYAVSKPSIIEPVAYPQLNALDESKEVIAYVGDINEIVIARLYEKMFRMLADHPEEMLYPLMGRGLDADGPMRGLKRAATLQLFAMDPLHLLIFTDDEDFRDLLMGNAKSLAPRAVVYTKDKFNELQLMAKGKGLLAQADGGLFIIGEFRCDKAEERASIIAAMDEGSFVPEKKGVKRRVAAKVSTLAFATPLGMKLMTSNLEILHTQIPFDKSYLPKFHLIFVLQRKNRHSDVHHSLRIIPEDVELVRRFVAFARESALSYDPALDEAVQRSVRILKERERFSFANITDKTVQAVKALAAARATMHLREKVEEEDVHEAVKVVRDSLFKVGAREAEP